MPSRRIETRPMRIESPSTIQAAPITGARGTAAGRMMWRPPTA